jgi:RHS repeat-associated protein
MAFGSDITETIGHVGGRTTQQEFNSSDDVRKQYAGYERDDESGLDYAQARYYNSNHGRFISVNPVDSKRKINGSAGVFSYFRSVLSFAESL